MKVVGSGRTSVADVTDPDKLPRRLHDVDLNRGSGSGLFVMKGVVIMKDILSISHFYEFLSTSMEYFRRP